jgi:hypothetical protein
MVVTHVNANVAVLKQQLEQLFPGKWLTGGDGDKILRTGIREIDSGIVSGLARRQISEWSGLSSSGKSTLLRGAVTYWCANGLNVAYVDTFSRLVASDWAFVKESFNSPVPLNMMQRKSNSIGEFFVVRVSENLAQQSDSTIGHARKKDIRLEACWVVEQLLRSTVFDAIIFDMGASVFLSDRTYARLKRALERSKTALIILKDQHLKTNFSQRNGDDNSTANGGWGCHTSMQFKWSTPVAYENGMHGIALISPTIQGSIARDGMTQNMEARLNPHVPNRLFTHPQIPDRRTPKV